MPPDIVATLNKAIRDAINTPEGKRFYEALGAEIGTRCRRPSSAIS